MREFIGFPSIERLNQNITITEKIHGSNAQILVDGNDIYAGSRTRWITPEDDNYNFAKWVHGNREALIKLLGEGSHFGEWYGGGINAGYGMKEKRFVLFNTFRWTEHKDVLAPVGVDVVPVLYTGAYDPAQIEATFQQLKTSGSVLVPAYNRPEGIVVRFDRSGVLMKRTFEAEDEAWTYKVERPAKPEQAELIATCAPFWQPMRLEKLLSRDERYSREYPTSLPDLCRDYLDDLFKETDGVEEATQKLIRKNAFPALKRMMSEKGFTV